MDLNIYPKSKELLRQDTIKALQLFVGSFPIGAGFDKEFITDELVDTSLKATLENNPRHLIDFFINYNIQIGVIPVNKNEYSGSIYYNFEFIYSYVDTNRVKLENLLFLDSFKLLEGKL